MRYAVIDQPDPSGVTVNVVSVIETDGDPPEVQPGQGTVCDPPDGVVAGWVFTAGIFAPPMTLASIQAAQVAALTSACAAQIVGGFSSSALGSPYTYPSGATDQANLSASVLASLMPNNPSGWTTPFLCADANGEWSFINHSATQIQQVGEDGKNAVLSARLKLASLSEEVESAATTSVVQAIIWT